MSNDVLQVVPVRMDPETVKKIDYVTGLVGGNRSEFVRMAVEERLQRMAPVLAMLAESNGLPEMVA